MRILLTPLAFFAVAISLAGNAYAQDSRKLALSAALCVAGSDYLANRFPSDDWRGEVARRTAQYAEIEPNAEKRKEGLKRVNAAFSKKALKKAIKQRGADISVEQAGDANAQLARKQCYHLDVWAADKARS